MKGRPKKYNTLENMTIIQIYEVLKNSKSMPKAAEELGVTLAELNTFKYKPENKKKLDALKKADQKKQADIEMGIEIVEEPIIKTKQVVTIQKGEEIINLKKPKSASEIEVKNDEIIKLQSRITELETLEAARRDEIEIVDRERLHEKARADRLQEEVERYKKAKDEAVKKQQESTNLLNERSKKSSDAMKAATMRIELLEKKNADQQEQLVKLSAKIRKKEDEIIEIESTHAATIADYEAKFKEQEETIKMNKFLDEVKGPQGLTINNDFTDDSQFYMMEPQKIQPPQHYATKDGIDLIQRFADKKKRDMFIGAMVFNISKYAERFGDKDDELSEARKMKDYSSRLVDYLELEVQ